VSRTLDLDFAAIPESSAARLREMLTERVTVANPFDIHTYLWFDPPALGRVFKTVLTAGYDAVGFMLDCPPEHKADSSSYHVVIDEFIAAAQEAAAGGTAARAALIASLPETISAGVRQRCFDGGVVPLQGQREALEALSLAGAIGAAWRTQAGAQLLVPPQPRPGSVACSLSEAEGKQALAAFGVPVPRGRVVPLGEVQASAVALGFPVVIKAAGAHLEHKSEVGGVVLNVRSADEAAAAGARLAALSGTVLVEQMTTDGVAEVLVGVIVDPQFGQVLVLGAGGVLTEMLSDSVSLLPPWTRESILEALHRLAVAKLLAGYRGKPPGDLGALVECILAIGRFAAASCATLIEIDVNPVIVRPQGRGVVAVDTMIRLYVSN
jgi:acetyl-CoA synthetase